MLWLRGARRPGVKIADRHVDRRVVEANSLSDGGVSRLGNALARRVEDVVSRLRELTSAAEVHLDSQIEAHFEDAARTSTVAVAGWIGGDSPESARDAGWDATRIFGMLAAQRAASLNEIMKRCLRWRDAMAGIIAEEALVLGCDDAVVSKALEMLRRSFDVTLVRMCTAFEAERHRLHAELIDRQAELAFNATHDVLTGLPNRTLIVDRIHQALGRARRQGTPVAVMFIDLDNFKYINDTYGHRVGDHLLRAVVARLSGVVRGTDTLGRLGGDEFVIVAEGFSLIAGPELMAERMLNVLRIPFAIEELDTPLTVTASIGIAAGERRVAEEYLRDADIAMYRAKWMGRDVYALFDSEMGVAAQSRLLLEMDLRDAISERQFFLVYQPIFDLDTMQMTGVEALLRWRHPVRGLVLPDEFVPLLEETGLIAAVGRTVLEHACRQGAAWHAGGHRLDVAVNVSARQLDTDDFVAELRQVLAATTFPPEHLTVEITETSLMRDPQASIRRLGAVKDLGVRVAIDDFGTGYSSLDYLRQFPVDTLKIDQSFIARMLRDAEGRALIQTLLQLGKALHIETVAEGIESNGQLTELRHQRCTSGQGFFLGQPLDASDVESFLATHTLKPASERPSVHVPGSTGARRRT